MEKTGVVENGKRVSIHPPRFAYMSFAEIAPQPSVNFPISVGVSRETSLSIVKGWDSLNNKTIKQHEEVIAFEDINLFGRQYKNCAVTVGENINHIQEVGQYHVKYWFDKNDGFVKIVYTKPDSVRIELLLKSIK